MRELWIMRGGGDLFKVSLYYNIYDRRYLMELDNGGGGTRVYGKNAKRLKSFLSYNGSLSNKTKPKKTILHKKKFLFTKPELKYRCTHDVKRSVKFHYIFI